MAVSKDGGPQDNPNFATSPDADDIDEPTAHRSSGFVVNEEIANAWFNWLSQTWGEFLDHFASNTRTFALLKDARQHARLERGDQFRYSPNVKKNGNERLEGDNTQSELLGYVTSSNFLSYTDIDTGGNYVIVAEEGAPAVHIYEPDLSSKITTITNFVGSVSDMHVVTDGEWYFIAYQDTNNAQLVVHTFDDFENATDAKVDETGRQTFATQYDIRDAVSARGEICLGLWDSANGNSRIEHGRNASFTTEDNAAFEVHSVAATNFDGNLYISWTKDTDDIDGWLTATNIGNVGTGAIEITVDDQAWYVIADPATSGSDPTFYKFGLASTGSEKKTEITTMEDADQVETDGRRVYGLMSNGTVKWANSEDGLVIGSRSTNISNSKLAIAADGRALYVVGSNGGSGVAAIAYHMNSAPVEWQSYPSGAPHPFMDQVLGPAR
ncbi:MAG: hypothetical protein ABEN55_12090 [Bradymonadaceae bacterium]